MKFTSSHSFFSPGFHGHDACLTGEPSVMLVQCGEHTYHVLRPFGVIGGFDIYASHDELLKIAHAILSAYLSPLDPSVA